VPGCEAIENETKERAAGSRGAGKGVLKKKSLGRRPVALENACERGRKKKKKPWEGARTFRLIQKKEKGQEVNSNSRRQILARGTEEEVPGYIPKKKGDKVFETCEGGDRPGTKGSFPRESSLERD